MLSKIMYEYENTKRIKFDGGAMFVPVCVKCGRFVKADKIIHLNGFGELVKKPNATCGKCGRAEMLFEGFM